MARADLRDALHRQVTESINRGAVPLLGCTAGRRSRLLLSGRHPRPACSPACRPTTKNCSARSRP
ncbi:MAG: hypothetical protein MZV65_19095 [Chromatiales bacterium]|nr:hypothetical protein [Chromatiales bacterium]